MDKRNLEVELSSGEKPWALVSDVDGVLTDGRFLYSSEGKQYKLFGSHDADALAKSKFFSKVVFVSADARGFEISKRRVSDMGWEIVLASSAKRVEIILELKSQFQVCYIGDSFTDLDAFEVADLSVCPQGAYPLARRMASVKLECRGGEGAIAELIHRLEGRWL